ncbi:uncharacterized protein LOC143905914 [Temnothorax americanus]|uniref:uncharacterized protein LOC143905914 n=1 Tax=Temnothorax americanus TaxID=1964332 RepID=UPI0040699258
MLINKASICYDLNSTRVLFPIQLNPTLVPIPLSSYSSFHYSAVGSLIGAKSGMVIGYGTRVKHCRLCQAGHSLDDHDCRLNWTGSARAMEPDIAVEITAKNKDFEEHNVKLGTLIGDDDSSTIAAVRRECSHPVAKWSDLNHATKKLSKALWAQKVPRDVIEYLKYCFGCALKKNKGNVEATENAIKNIIPHAFDEHAKCGEWCRYAEDLENYTHNGLPGGKGLTGQTMRQTLAAIFDVFWKNDKLAPCGSSQSNEAFNSSVSAKSCKAHHYAGSESFDFRIAATVCEKNIGTKYIVNLNKKLGLSPGKVTEEFRKTKNYQRAKRRKRASKPETKRRRLFMQKQRSNKKNKAERKEGITYSTECRLDGITELIDSLVVSPTAPQDSPLVYFDLETTGLSVKYSEICQIAARYEDQEFSA